MMKKKRKIPKSLFKNFMSKPRSIARARKIIQNYEWLLFYDLYKKDPKFLLNVARMSPNKIVACHAIDQFMKLYKKADGFTCLSMARLPLVRGIERNLLCGHVFNHNPTEDHLYELALIPSGFQKRSVDKLVATGSTYSAFVNIVYALRNKVSWEDKQTVVRRVLANKKADWGLNELKSLYRKFPTLKSEITERIEYEQRRMRRHR